MARRSPRRLAVVCLCDPERYAAWHRDHWWWQWDRNKRRRMIAKYAMSADHGPARLGYDLIAGLRRPRTMTPRPRRSQRVVRRMPVQPRWQATWLGGWHEPGLDRQAPVAVNSLWRATEALGTEVTG